MTDAEHPAPDLREHGRDADGQPAAVDRRLFMQLLAFTGCDRDDALTAALNATGLPGVLYQDVHDPRGVALLTWHEDPDHFVTAVRPMVQQGPFASLTPRPELTMFGRTYAIGHERPVEQWLIDRPIDRAVDESLPWAVWYPLRRTGAFEQLEADRQRRMLMEHGRIGRRFAEGGLAQDIRLACHGIDRHDNDFVIGLVGRRLHPLSAIVQAMRGTEQTSQYLERLGPFFVGRVLWRRR